jgi:adenosylhomocysteine nucleosidase
MANIKTLMENPLYVFALQSEAVGHFEHTKPLFVGVGKLNAMYSLMKRIAQKKPSIIINLGSAGSTTHKRGEVVCCNRFIQRDMDVTPLGFEKYKTPFSLHPPVMYYGLEIEGLPQGVCGTGDSFVTSHDCNDYDVIDMEAFPLAWVAMQEEIPFLCLKYISDGADGAAATDWPETVKLAAEALRKALDGILQ